MAELPYHISLRATVAASTAATLQHAVPRNEELVVVELYSVSSGAFSVTSIRDSAGRVYGNLSTSAPLPNAIINSERFKAFPTPIRLSGAITLYVDVLDTSAATNTITIVLVCTRITQ